MALTPPVLNSIPWCPYCRDVGDKAPESGAMAPWTLVPYMVPAAGALGMP